MQLATCFNSVSEQQMHIYHSKLQTSASSRRWPKLDGWQAGKGAAVLARTVIDGCIHSVERDLMRLLLMAG